MSSRQGNREPSTSELRHDWLSDRWVIIAPQRTERPDDFARSFEQPNPSPVFAEDPTRANCPFCRGHETETPPPLAVYSLGGGHDPVGSEPWHVRVVPNKFPAVNGVQSLKFPGMGVEGVGNLFDPTGSHAHTNSPYSNTPYGSKAVLGQPGSTHTEVEASSRPVIDLFQARHVTGAHEVIIESPLHLCSLTQLDRCTTTLIFRAYRDRLQYWSRCLDIAYSVVFKNVGQDAGASLVHTHSQLIATNILPTDVRRAVERMELFHHTEGDCLFCRMLVDELEENVRLVAQTSDFVAFCPFASRLPSLVTIVPRDHQSAFESTSDEGLEQLAWLVHRMLRSIERCYPQAAYNYVLHTAPQGKRESPAFHWRLELFPRLTRVAGFEWGSDCFINPLPPELAAHRLRRQAID